MNKNLITIAIISLLATGCVTKTPPKAEAAPQSADGSLLFQADTIIKNGGALVGQFISFEYQNRLLLAHWPQVQTTANTLQAKTPEYIEEVIATRKMYHDNPTPGTKAQLASAVGTFTAAYEQANSFEVQAQQYFAAHPPADSTNAANAVPPTPQPQTNSVPKKP